MNKFVLDWVNRRTWLFGRHQWSDLRDLGLLCGALVMCWGIITLPELILDESKHAQTYRNEVNGYLDNCYHNSRCAAWLNVDEKALAKARAQYPAMPARAQDDHTPWISRRMARYRNLVWCTNACQDKCDRNKAEEELAQWQFKVLPGPDRGEKTTTFMHYRVNPGFFWDIGLFLPVSLAALLMGLHALLSHIQRCQIPTTEALHPYIPRGACAHFLSTVLDPGSLSVCVAASLAITAANQGYSLENQGTGSIVFQSLFWVCLAVIPALYIWFAIRGARGILRVANQSDESPSSFGCEPLAIIPQWVMGLIVFGLTAALGALIAALSVKSGWIEGITGMEIVWWKPIQRFIKHFLTAYGSLIATWTGVLVIAYGRRVRWRTERAGDHGGAIDVDEEAKQIDSIARCELRVIDFYAVFAMFTLLSYFQSMLHIFDVTNQAPVEIAIPLQTGLIIIALVLFVPPLCYLGYIGVDVNRCSRWANSLRASGRLSEADVEKVTELVETRLRHLLLKVYPLRTGWILPSASFLVIFVLVWRFCGWCINWPTIAGVIVGSGG